MLEDASQLPAPGIFPFEMEPERCDGSNDGIPASYRYDSSVDLPPARVRPDVATLAQANIMNASSKACACPYSQDLGATVAFPPGVHEQPYHREMLPGTNDRHVPGGMHDQPNPAVPSVADMAGNLYSGNDIQGRQPAAPSGKHYDPQPASSSLDYWYPANAGPVPTSHNAVGYGPPQDPAAHGWAHRGAAWDTQPPPPVTQMPPANQGSFGGTMEPSVRILWIQRGGDRSTFMMIEIS
ncbi:hypothetical protein BC834DRAFT_966677 [Gloeopeniophorella convolvens]|nr:hypothetical protein BC834DRAFT_966677 [Gloeopeniophorella convolvens]